MFERERETPYRAITYSSKIESYRIITSSFDSMLRASWEIDEKLTDAQVTYDIIVAQRKSKIKMNEEEKAAYLNSRDKYQKALDNFDRDLREFQTETAVSKAFWSRNVTSGLESISNELSSFRSCFSEPTLLHPFGNIRDGEYCPTDQIKKETVNKRFINAYAETSVIMDEEIRVFPLSRWTDNWWYVVSNIRNFDCDCKYLRLS